MRKKILALILLSSFSLHSATIAVIDSGVDVEHRDFINKLWINPNEIADNYRDEDRNGYQDDVFGWNFAENNNLVIDRKYIGTFSKDPFKFFEIQGKAFLGNATEEELNWLKEKRKDPDFIKEMSKFGNFVHGTHVAGITQKDNAQAKILSVKLIPTEVGLSKLNNYSIYRELLIARFSKEKKGFRMRILKQALTRLAKEQTKRLEEIAHYVNGHKAQVANGSFGTGYKQAKTITDNLFRVLFFRKPKEEESHEVAAFFVNELVRLGKSIAQAAPKTLFVFAAGNDAQDNDAYPTSPTNIIAPNVISVAATYKNLFLAPFSNYGEKMVDVAAPGMLINSQIPDNDYLSVSGTSQAAPFVANIAAQIFDTNTALTPEQVKKIITQTVDKKIFLLGKVKSGGSVNTERALFAAKESLTMSVESAILYAKAKVRVRKSFAKSKIEISQAFNSDITPIALPSMFKVIE